MRTSTRLLASSLALVTAGTLAACGDDHGGNPDANGDDVGIDATPDTPVEPTADRSMTIAVTDVTLLSADAQALGVTGGSIGISFDDITQGGGQVVFGTSPVGGCVVVQYDATHPKAPQVDAGTVTIGASTNANLGDGRNKAIGPCNYVDGAGYVCVSNTDTDQAQNATAVGTSGLVTYTFPAQTFPTTGQNLIGSYLVVAGFTNANFNSPAGSAFPIVNQPSATQLVVSNPAGVGQTAETIAAGGTFTVMNGYAPAPGGGDYLGDQTTGVHISKADDANWGAIDADIYVRGEGLDLDDVSDDPTAFPSTSQALNFSCGGTGGTCGADSNDDPSLLEAVIVSGKTTDADVSGTNFDFEMPPATTWVEWQCGYPLGTAAAMPAGAVQAILDSNPTRVETRVLSVAGQIPSDPNNDLNSGFIVVGHALVGHTTMN
jgi:hypothetical protein